MQIKENLMKIMENPWSIPGSILAAIIINIFAPNFSASIGPFGDFYLSFFSLAIIPILFSSICLSVTTLLSTKGALNFKKMTVIFMVMYAIATVSGILLANMLDFSDDVVKIDKVQDIILSNQTSNIPEASTSDVIGVEEADGIVKFLIESVPTNIFNALSEGEMVNIIVFALLFGVALTVIPKDNKEFLINFIQYSTEPFRTFIDWAVAVLPIGLFCQISQYLSMIDDPSILIAFWKFICVSISVMLLLTAVSIVVSAKLLKISLLAAYKNVEKSLLVAFSTADQVAALPTFMDSLYKKTKLKKEDISFILPMGVSLFPFGALFFFSCLAMFVANIHGIHINFSGYVLICITTFFAAVSETAMPLTTIPIILNPLGIPAVFVTTFLVALDWIFAPFRAVLSGIMNYLATIMLAKTENTP